MFLALLQRGSSCGVLSSWSVAMLIRCGVLARSLGFPPLPHLPTGPLSHWLAESSDSVPCGNDQWIRQGSAHLGKVKALSEIPETIYSIVADAYGDEVSNAAFHSPPYAQCSMRFTELTSRGAVWPSYKRHAAFKEMTRETLTKIVEKLFHEEGCHVEAWMGAILAGAREKLVIGSAGSRSGAILWRLADLSWMS